MANYTLVPFDNLLIVDGKVAQNINYSGLDPLITAVQWYGVEGQIEYYKDPMTGLGQPNENIYSMAQFQTYINQAEQIIYAQENPVTYYVTVSDGLYYSGSYFGFGTAVEVTDVGWPQPSGTTTLVPPTPNAACCQAYFRPSGVTGPQVTTPSNQQLYWYNNNWVVSFVDPTFSLATAKSVLIDSCQNSASIAFSVQCETYTTLQLLQATPAADLPCSYIYNTTLGEYQTYLDGQVASITATINAATSVPQLYGVDPQIEPNP